jgi:hypothetical protein
MQGNVRNMSDQMSRGRRAVIIGGIVLVAIGGISYSRYASHRAHEQLLAFRASLSLELSENDVEAKFKSGRYTALTLLREGEDVWTVDTPLEFGAGNWYLRLIFKDKSLRGVLVRTPDLPLRRPGDAPPDILTADSSAK